MNKKAVVIFIFSLTTFFGVSTNIIEGSPNDPGEDGSYYYDIAENLKEGRGFTLDIKEYWLDNWNETEKIGKVENQNFGIVMYPLFESVVLIFDDSLMTIRIANSIISGFTVVIFYMLTSRLFDDRIAFLSSILFIFNPLFFSVYTSIISEAFYMLVYLIPFYIILGDNSERVSTNRLFLAGIMSGVAFLSRMVGLLVVISIVLWLAFQREYKKASIYSISSFISVIPWLIWNKLTFGYLFPYAHVVGSGWPEAGVEDGSTSIQIIEYVKNIMNFGIELTSPSMFFILAPFVLIGLLRFSNDRKKSLLIIFSILTVLFHLIVNYSVRYMLPIVPLMIPVGLGLMRELLMRFDAISFFNISITGKKIMAFLVLFILFNFLLGIASNIKDARDETRTNHNYEKYQWLEKISLGNDIVCSTEPGHAHYFTGRQTIILAYNLNQTWLDEFIDFYNISYVVVEGKSYPHYEDNDYLNTLYYGNDTYLLGKYNLVLVHEELGFGNDILFYEVEKTMDTI